VLLAKPTVAVVGSREHTCYARQSTFALARDLARAGVTVISGVNQGLEGIAHRGVLAGGGSAIAADLGHDVAVVPGRVSDRGGARMFGLLRDGAHPVSCADDVLELIGDGVTA
jgi:DNA processing protein